MRVLVLGAGLAGLTAALELSRRGFRVTVIEAAPFAGGRTSSWTENGVQRDTGLHVVADHYLNFIDMLESLGVADRLMWWSQHAYLHPDRRPLTMRSDPYPAPFHLLHAGRSIPVTLSERLRLVTAAVQAAAFTQADLARLDDQPYLDWHRERGLGDGYLLELAGVGADAAAFLKPEEISARAMLSWMKYLARDRKSIRLATWRGPLAEDLVRPLVAAFQRNGGELLTNRAAVGIDVSAGSLRGVHVCATRETGAFHRADGCPSIALPSERIACDAIVSGLPVQSLTRILTPEQLERAGLQRIVGLGTVPATSVTLFLNERIPSPAGVPLVARCAIRDLIDVSLRHRGSAPGSVFQTVVSRGVDVANLDNAALADRLHRDLERIWPPARTTRLVSATVERIGAALFAAVPGAHARRPTAVTGIRGMFLAGDWTRHDLNASMEGAVLSGRLAARALAGDLARDLSIKAVREPAVTQLVQRLARPLVSLYPQRGESSSDGSFPPPT